jgi:hypothetical protein
LSEKEGQPPTSELEGVKIFNAKELGRSLREVAVEVLQKEDHNIESHWYHSAKDADMFIWKDQHKNIIKQQVTFYGQLIEWNVLEGVRTGLLIEDEVSQKIGSSPLIRYDSVPQQHGIEQGVDIVSHVQGLTQSDKLKIIENFIQSPHFNQMTPEEVMKRYGLHRQKTQNLTWLTRLMMALGLSVKNK